MANEIGQGKVAKDGDDAEPIRRIGRTRSIDTSPQKFRVRFTIVNKINEAERAAARRPGKRGQVSRLKVEQFLDRSAAGSTAPLVAAPNARSGGGKLLQLGRQA